jgi:hypothetical protein
LNRAVACLALAGLAALPRSLGAQGIPEALKNSALAVRVYAIIPTAQASGQQSASPAPSAGTSTGSSGDTSQASPATGDKGNAWEAERVKYTVPGTPVPFKFVGANVVILVQVTPFSRQDAKGVVLVAQGQVWIKSPEGGLSYHTAIDTLSLEYGETVFFFPLGVDAAGKAPIRLEIAVLHAADLPNPQDEGADDKGGTSDKGGTGDKAGK